MEFGQFRDLWLLISAGNPLLWRYFEVKILSVNWTALAALGLSLILGNTSAHAGPPYGSGEFACQVTTADGGQGLVLVQANNEEKAREVAGSAQQVHTMLGNLSQAISLVECIRRPTGRFKDANFQLYYANVPL